MVGFLLMFGVAGSFLTRTGHMTQSNATVTAAIAGAICAVLLTRLAVATARFRPEHDPEDVRFLLQGRVGMVLAEIPAGGEGVICYEDAAATPSMRAREVNGNAIAAGVEICIDHLDADIAYVEPWAHVEERL